MLATTRLNTCQWSCRTFPRPWVPVQALHCAAQLGVTTSHRAFQSGCCPTQPGLRRVGYYKSIDGLSCRKRPVKTTTITCSSIARSPVATDRTAALRTFLFNQFVPIGLITAIIVGTFAPQPGAHAAKYGVLRTATTGIFFISGLNLKRGETQRALAARGAVLYGLASILLITPFLGLAALRLPLQPPELAFGLAVFCCMPTTLSSGVSLTAQCEGNTALALLLTVGSNLLGVFTMPFILPAVIGAATSNISLSPVQLLTSLVQCILIPLLVGATCRATIPGLAGWVDRNRKPLQLANGTLLCSTPWTQVSVAVLQGNTLTPVAVGVLLLCSVLHHAVMFAFNSVMVRLLKLGGYGPEARHIRRAVVLCASQKTLPVAVTILHKLSGVLGGAVGLAVIPCVVSHMAQIVLDSMVVSRWIKKDKEQALAAATTATAATAATAAQSVSQNDITPKNVPPCESLLGEQPVEEGGVVSGDVISEETSVVINTVA